MEVAPALSLCKQAGIRIIMITEDNKKAAIAKLALEKIANDNFGSINAAVEGAVPSMLT